MRGFTSGILSLLLAASLAACGGTGTAQDGGDSSGSDTAPALTGEISGEITVAAYDTMAYRDFLENAAKLFEEKYPGVTVNVETFSAMPEIKTSEQGGMRMSAVRVEDDPQGRQDYINKTGAALMSGEGADVLAMDVLPIYKYADSGQLENLDGYMEADSGFNLAGYRGNIIDAVKYGGGTWFIPTDYTFDFYAYDSTLLTGGAASGFGTGSAFTTEQLVALAQSGFDGSSKLFASVDYLNGRNAGLWSDMLEENYKSFVDVENKSANFADGGFAALLNTVRDYGEKGYVQKGAELQRMEPGDMFGGGAMRSGPGGGAARMSPEGETGGEPGDEAMPTPPEGEDNTEADGAVIVNNGSNQAADRFFFKPQGVYALINQAARAVSGPGMRMNIMMASSVASIDEDDEIAGIRANADGSIPFTFEQGYGINSGSKNKEAAWAFIKFLLTEEMQLSSSTRPTALPLLNSAREKKAGLMISGEFMGGEGQPLTDEQREALAVYNKTVEQLSDQINAYVYEDAVVNDMIAAETAYFFDGTKSADEVAGALQSKVELYLNE